MKSIVNRIMVVLAIAALTSVVASAKVHKQKINFDSDTKVNGTVLKKGSYDLKFDDESGQLSIMKNGKVVATATAKAEQRETKAKDFQLRTGGSGEDVQLVGVTFGGSDKDIIVTNGGGSTSGTN